MSNKNTPEEMIACIQAWQRGEKIQFETHTGWLSVSDPLWEFATCRYRITPKPKDKKLRPWKPEEVPVGAQVKNESNPSLRMLIVCAWDFGVRLIDGGSMPIMRHDQMLNGFTHSTDGGKTWDPCGVEVEE